MKKIRITGVPEHFNFPWIQVVGEQPLHNQGITLEWINEPRGSGAMCKALREDETDLAILLTESFIKDATEGNTAKCIGLHVATPLIWGIHVAATSPFQNLKDFSEKHFFISRQGSGSHLMAFVLAQREGWKIEDLVFEQIVNLDGALNAFGSGSKGIFLWEKFMTKPFVDEGKLRRIGEIPSPWPCFSIVASKAVLEKYPLEILLLREEVYKKSRALKHSEFAIAQLAEAYQLQAGDVKEWLSQTDWAYEGGIAKEMLEKTMDLLLDLGIIDKTIPASSLVNPAYVKLI
jgi:ABC-type nitrate/sulfonate/bicarbonate transport system substrate-binding protein